MDRVPEMSIGAGNAQLATEVFGVQGAARWDVEIVDFDTLGLQTGHVVDGPADFIASLARQPKYEVHGELEI
jgi:hypothetical protein